MPPSKCSKMFFRNISKVIVHRILQTKPTKQILESKILQSPSLFEKKNFFHLSCLYFCMVLFSSVQKGMLFTCISLDMTLQEGIIPFNGRETQNSMRDMVCPQPHQALNLSLETRVLVHFSSHQGLSAGEFPTGGHRGGFTKQPPVTQQE